MDARSPMQPAASRSLAPSSSSSVVSLRIDRKWFLKNEVHSA